MTEITNKIGQIVEGRRRQIGLTQAELATRAGLTQKTISAIENGKQDMNSTTMIKLVRVLDVSPSELIGLTQTPLPDHLLDPAARTVIPARDSLLAGIVVNLPALKDDQLRALFNIVNGFVQDNAETELPKQLARKKN